jgi:hypothetical protein
VRTGRLWRSLILALVLGAGARFVQGDFGLKASKGLRQDRQ